MHHKVPDSSGVLTYFSVRLRVVMFGVVMPVGVLAGILVLVFWFVGSLSEDSDRLRKIFEETRIKRQEVVQTEKELDRYAPDMQLFSISAGALLQKVTEFASQYSVTVDTLTDNVPTAALAISGPVSANSQGLHLVIRGSPERIHNFFISLEHTFPSLMVQSTKTSLLKDDFVVDTVYLIPAFTKLSRQ